MGSEWIEMLVDALKNRDYLTLVLLLLVAVGVIAKNLPEYLTYWKAYRNAKKGKILEVLGNPDLSSQVKKHYREELELELFRRVHGVNIGFPFYSASMAIKARVGQEVDFRHVLKVMKFSPGVRNIDAPSYRVNLGWLASFYCWVNLLVALSFYLIGCIAGAFWMFHDYATWHLIIVCVVAFLTAFWAAGTASALSSAKHINKALDNWQREQ